LSAPAPRAAFSRRSSRPRTAGKRPAPHSRASAPRPEHASAAAELLKVLLKMVAEDYGVAPRIIANGEDLERIAADEEADVPAMKGWRRQLFGEQALALKRGELALSLSRKGIVALPLERETAVAAE
jgi:ribonuclease D